MRSRNLRFRLLALTLLFCALAPKLSLAADEPSLTKEQIQHSARRPCGRLQAPRQLYWISGMNSGENL